MRLNTPLNNSDLQKLKLGDIIYLSGRIFTGRDRVHKYLYEGNESPVDLNGQVLYHCGPIAVHRNRGWDFWGFGPTTSIRQEHYTDYMIGKLGVKALIGKGGMGKKTEEACRKYKAVYLHAIGGCGVILANCVKKVCSVYLKEFGTPEAMWEVAVENFPAIVTIDAKGNSLHTKILAESNKKISEWSNQKERQKSRK